MLRNAGRIALLLTLSACGGTPTAGPVVSRLGPDASAEARADAAACDTQDRSACARLALRYFHGEGVRRDYGYSSALRARACSAEPLPAECSRFINPPGEQPPPLQPGQIAAAIQSQRGPLDACFTELVQKTEPNASGAVNVQFNVAADGRVEAAQVVSHAFDARFIDCMSPRLGAIVFPPPEGGRYAFSVPIQFPAPR